MPATPLIRLRPLPTLFAALAMLSLGACAPKQDTPPETAPAAASTPEAAPATTPETSPEMASDPVESATPAPGDATAQCNADAAQSFVGKTATEATVAEAKAAAGAKGALRLVKPGEAVTMDFRSDRLNIEVDAQNAIVRITCG
jgi:hypothetical protein